MNKNAENGKAYDRLMELVSIGLSNDGVSRSSGNWSVADCDEIATLTNICAPVLPKKFVELISSRKFGSDQMDQRAFADRLQRSIDVHNKFGAPQSKREDNALIPVFTLNTKDRDRVLKLCGDMRKIILASTDFDEPHKIHMLNRIAAVEKQAIDKRGMLDVVRGAASDVGETLGKFGKDIKPLTDRFKEVVSITRRATPEYDQIPAPDDLKRLPAPDDEE